jgi:hypothetical protein
MNATPPALLTVDQVAQLLAEHPQTVRKHTRAGRYPFAVNVGTTAAPRWRYDPRGLTRWVESRRTAA